MKAAETNTFAHSEAVNRKVNYAISNSLGFGGHNGSIMVKKFEV